MTDETQRNVLIIDEREENGSIQAFAVGFAPSELDEVEAEAANATSAAFVTNVNEGKVGISVANDETGEELLTIISSDQFAVLVLAMAGDLEAIEESGVVDTPESEEEE